MWEEGRRGKEAGWPTQCCHSSFSMDPYQETNIIRYLCNMIASSYGALATRFFSCFIILKGHYSCFFIWSGKRTFRLLSLRSPYLHYDGKKLTSHAHFMFFSPLLLSSVVPPPTRKESPVSRSLLDLFLALSNPSLTLLFALCSNTPEIMDKSGLEEVEERIAISKQWRVWTKIKNGNRNKSKPFPSSPHFAVGGKKLIFSPFSSSTPPLAVRSKFDSCCQLQ